jgi:predicted component of type VI protein secretion system
MIGLLCVKCSEAIAPPPGLLPQQIVVGTTGESEAALIDHWGRAHLLLTCTPIGRSIATNGISILDASVSRSHARIARTQGTWRVHDVGSLNGTLVNLDPVTERVLMYGDQIGIGVVTFFVVFDIGRLMRFPAPIVKTAVAASRTRATPVPQDESARLRLTQPGVESHPPEHVKKPARRARRKPTVER